MRKMKRSKKFVLAGTAHGDSQEMGTEGKFRQLPKDQLQSRPLPPLPVTPERTFRVPGIGTFFKRKKLLKISEVPPPVPEHKKVAYGFETSRPELEGWEQDYSRWNFMVEPVLEEEHFKHLKTKYGFHFGKIIGKGSYGTVYKVKQTLNDGTKLKLACKVTSLENFRLRGFRVSSVQDAVKSLNREADIYKTLDHPNVVKRVDIIHFYDRFTDFSPPIHVLIFMELMEGSLSGLLFRSPEWRLSERETHNWVKQVVEGLMYLHRNRISHLDIKPGNILYSTIPDSSQYAISGKRYTFKLTDFGDSRKFSLGKPMEITAAVGTKNFMAPEILVPNSPFDTAKADVYSLGITILVSLSGKTIRHDKMRNRCVVWSQRSGISKELAQLVVAMTEDEPSSRLSLTQVYQNPWIRDMFGEYDDAYYETTRL